MPGRPLDFTPEQLDMICLDHVNCLYRLRQCEVDQTIALDRRHERHLGLAKFLVEAGHAPEVAPAEGREAFARLAERVRTVMDSAYGARLLLVNRVLNETLTESIDVEGSDRSA